MLEIVKKYYDEDLNVNLFYFVVYKLKKQTVIHSTTQIELLID